MEDWICIPSVVLRLESFWAGWAQCKEPMLLAEVGGGRWVGSLSRLFGVSGLEPSCL